MRQHVSLGRYHTIAALGRYGIIFIEWQKLNSLRRLDFFGVIGQLQETEQTLTAISVSISWALTPSLCMDLGNFYDKVLRQL